MRKFLLVVISIFFLTGGIAAAEDMSWLQIGGDYRFRGDWLRGTVHGYIDGNPFSPTSGTFVNEHTVKNDDLFLNRFGLNLKATPLEDVSVKARMVMYKIWGQETPNAALDNAAADRGQLMDGTVGHIPQDNTLRVDYAYATVSNIFEAPIWFSIGRRPSTNGIPSNLRENTEKTGTAGIPSIMVDYAFDGLTLGYAPDIEALPGFYVKLCYGKGFDPGFQKSGDNLKDTSFYGVNAAIVDSENLQAQIQYQRGSNIFNVPSDGMVSTVTNTSIGGQSTLTFPVSANLGDIDWVGGIIMGKIANLNLFLSAAESMTDPKGSAVVGQNAGQPVFAGLLNNGTGQDRHKGYAFYVGGRYDIASTKTKIGAEYNQGSKYWVGFTPASDDIWTGKLGTRGSVYEIYLIQELNRKPISKNGKAFIRLGYQYYKFDYTGSSNWVGAPMKISDISSDPSTAQFFPPIENAKDLYLTFDVQF